MCHAFLYCMESFVRVLVKPSPLLLFHHALFFLLLACGLWLGPSMLMIKATLVLDLGAVHELPLYVALLTYRHVGTAQLAISALLQCTQHTHARKHAHTHAPAHACTVCHHDCGPSHGSKPCAACTLPTESTPLLTANSAGLSE